jgi:hypothetical protein
MKKCCICKKEKSNDSFSSAKSSADGLYARCKDCDREKEKLKPRNHSYRKDRYHKNPLRQGAHSAVYLAIKSGKIQKNNICAVFPCENTPVFGHHYAGYDKKNWLNIIWLCQKHHSLAHRK